MSVHKGREVDVNAAGWETESGKREKVSLVKIGDRPEFEEHKK